jgi:hypothetical protein
MKGEKYMKKLILVLCAFLLAQAHPAIAQNILIDGLKAARSCAGDIRKHCSGIEPGDGRIRACIKEKFAELSPDCKDALGELIAVRIELPNDSEKVELKHFENLRAVQYAEIFLIAGNPVSGDLRANVYNTIGLNGYNETNKDSSPNAVVAKVNPETLKKQYEVLGVHVNGPKLWMLDWIDVPVGTERDFNGLMARWVGLLDLKGIDLKDPSAGGYRTTSIERKTKFGYLKGRPAFLIDDAEGNTWIMKGMNLGLNPTQSYETAKDLGSRLKKLPPGWKFRVAVLPEDLVLIPTTGIAEIMPDELFNVYDKTGPGYSNYKP